MAESLSSSAQKVQDALSKLGFQLEILELPGTTRSAAEAAQTIGCRVEQIAKSLVFRGMETDSPFLVIASGSNRVSEKKLSKLVLEPIEKANADFVRSRTGFVIGGVPPVGHLEQLKTFGDGDLMTYQEIWAAAGNPNAVFKLTPVDLVAMTKASVVKIK